MSTDPTSGDAPADSEAAANGAVATPASPIEGAREAVTAARDRLSAAAAALAAGGADSAGQAIEAASGSVGEVARALWLLRRAAQPQASPQASTSETTSPGVSA